MLTERNSVMSSQIKAQLFFLKYLRIYVIISFQLCIYLEPGLNELKWSYSELVPNVFFISLLPSYSFSIHYSTCLTCLEGMGCAYNIICKAFIPVKSNQGARQSFIKGEFYQYRSKTRQRSLYESHSIPNYLFVYIFLYDHISYL